MGNEIDPAIIFAQPDYAAHWADWVSTEQYHADRHAVNQGALKDMDKSPATFYGRFFLRAPKTPTAAMKFGTLAHMAILEGAAFRERYVVMPEFMELTLDGKPSAQSKGSKEKRAAWVAEQQPGAVICTVEERDTLLGMVESLVSHQRAFALLRDGIPEAIGYWRDPSSGIRCRFMADFVAVNLGALIDYKTTEDCTWDTFRKSVEHLRYDVQICHYGNGAQAITGIPMEHKVWIAQEKEIPYEVACHEMPPEYEATGQFTVARSLKRIKESVLANQWPQRQADIELGEMSKWFFQRFELAGAFDGIINV